MIMRRRLIFYLILIFSQCVNAQTNKNDKITEIISLIKQEYIAEINIDSIVNQMVHDYLNDTSTIRKLLDHLDPYSHYLDEKDYGEMKTVMHSNFQGIGLAFIIVNDTVIVSRVFENGPAEKAGLRTGDKIITIN